MPCHASLLNAGYNLQKSDTHQVRAVYSNHIFTCKVSLIVTGMVLLPMVSLCLKKLVESGLTCLRSII